MKSERKATPRRKRLLPGAYETMRALETFSATPETAPALDLLADVLGMWARYMVAANPAAGADIYRALLGAWRVNRAESEREHDGRDQLTVLYHVAFRNRAAELLGRPADLGLTSLDFTRAADLAGHMRDALDGMSGRVGRAAAPAGEGHAAPELDADPWAELGEGFKDFLEEEGIED